MPNRGRQPARGRQSRGGGGARGSTSGGRGRGRGHSVEGGQAYSVSSTSTEATSPTERARGRGFQSRSTTSRPANRRGRGGRVDFQIYDESRPRALNDIVPAQELGDLISKIQKNPSTVPGCVIRPGFGKEGIPATLLSNFFVLKYPKDLVLYEYGIELTPDVTTKEKRTRKRLFDLFELTPEYKQYSSHLAHDGAQKLVSNKLLPAGFVVEIQFTEEGKETLQNVDKVYTIRFTEPIEHATADLDRYLQGDDMNYNPAPILAALNLIVSAHASREAVPFGRHRYFYDSKSFSPQEPVLSLSDGVEAWKGFFVSVRPSYKHLMVNVNVCMSAFYTQSKLSDAISTFRRGSYGADPKQLYKIRVSTTHLGYRRRFRVEGFGDTTARTTFFQCDELGGKISIEDYFRKKYKIELQHADDLPVVRVGSKGIFLPAEVCEIEPGEPYTMTLSRFETTNMINNACRAPYENARIIEKQGLSMLGLEGPNAFVAGYGIQVSTQMTEVPARMLKSPEVMYQAKRANVADGNWNMRNSTFHLPVSIASFAVLCISSPGGRDDFRGTDDPALDSCIEQLVKGCRNSGMTVPDEPSTKAYLRLPSRNANRSNVINSIETEIREFTPLPDIVFVLLPHNFDFYAELKILCDVKLGVHTTCMLTSNIKKERGQIQFLANVALKVNAKLGGVNHCLDQSSMSWLEDTMLVGMDVTHPSAGSLKGAPSIAAVVASCDNHFFHYPASLRVHSRHEVSPGVFKRQEMIVHVDDMMKERLEEYNRNMKKLPAKIIVFRDGVSEGEFDRVMMEELPKIQKSFNSFPHYNPKLTIIICGKRHHARFYPTRRENADSTSNTKAGTVVDQGVTGVYDFDYYLQAHAAIKGTARPAHYTVLYDENHFDPDTIQKGTNSISYLWAPATKSVSLAPPAYWADRACDRARLYLHEIYSPGSSLAKKKKMDEAQVLKKAYELWGNGIHERLKSSMFYV